MAKEPSKVLPQYIAATAANFATVAAGCALGWTSPALPKITIDEKHPEFNEGWLYLDTEESSWVGSLVPAGAILGPFLVAFLADRIGRKWSLLSTAIPALIGWIMITFLETFAPICVARFIMGVGVGMVFAVTPMYVGEIAEDRVRGALGSFLQLQIVAGFLFEYCIGPYVSYVEIAAATCAIPVLFVIFFYFMPETPVYLLTAGKHEDAVQSLMRLRGQSREGVQQELKIMQAEVEENQRNKAKMTDLVSTKGNFKALYICLALVTGQQLAGINAVLFYSQNIFESSNGPLKGAEATIVIGVVMFLASGVTPIVVERLGRKMLLLISAVGMIIGLVALGVYFYLLNDGQDVSDISILPILSLVFYIIVYSIGYGPLPWAVLGELFPANVRSNASACTASFCWVVGFFVTRFYADMADGLGSHWTFWIFAIITVASGAFIALFLPETKGKSLQEIQDILNR